MRDVVKLTSEMVAFDTESSKSNLALAEFLGETFEEMGFQVQLQKKVFPAERDNSKERKNRLGEREKNVRRLFEDTLGGFGFSPEVKRRDSAEVTKANLIARIGPQDSEPLMMCGHMDVVPPGDLEKWKLDGNTINPFNLTYNQKRDFLYGRGSVDMKGPLAAMICAVEPLVKRVGQFRRELIFGLTFDEEVGLKGARYMVEEGIVRPKFTLIAEPTELFPVRMHKGHMRLSAFCHGKRVHAADPDRGRNAIELASLVIRELEKFRDELKFVKQKLIRPPYATLNIGLISGGSKLNEVPDGCVVSFAIRPLPGQSPERTRDYIEKRLEAVGGYGKDGKPLVTVEAFDKTTPPTYPLCTPANSELVRVAEEVSGKAARGISYSTDASVLQELGTECLIFGPGDIDVAHQPLECIEARQLLESVGLFREIVARMCLTGEVR